MIVIQTYTHTHTHTHTHIIVMSFGFQLAFKLYKHVNLWIRLLQSWYTRIYVLYVCKYTRIQIHASTCIHNHAYTNAREQHIIGQALAAIEASLRKHSDKDTAKDGSWNLVSESDPWNLLFAAAFSDRAKHVVHARFSDMQVWTHTDTCTRVCSFVMTMTCLWRELL